MTPQAPAPTAGDGVGEPGKVYLVDDDVDVLAALEWLLACHDLASVAFTQADEFRQMVERQTPDWPHTPSCLVLDVRMPRTSGLVLFDWLRERALLHRLPVLFLTGHGDVRTAALAVRQGATDFVEKPFTDAALVRKIEDALHSSAQALADHRTLADLAARLDTLTARERVLADAVVQGGLNKSIASDLAMSVRAVEAMRARIFHKMGVQSAVELSIQLERLRLRSPAPRRL